MSQGRRRGSRLFSGSPELLLVSEDIPGIVMPAPPASFPALEEDEEPEFDLSALHAQEDAEEEAEASEGPLRLYIGAPSADTEEPAAVPEVEDDAPIWDVSALAMPAAPDEEGESLDFLDEDEDVDDEDVVPIDAAPPPLVMSVSSDVSEGMSPPSDWEDSPTVPAQMAPAETSSAPAVIRDTPPPVRLEADGDPVDLPDRLPFAEETAAALDMSDEDVFLAQDMPTKVDAIMSMGEENELGPIENEWDDDDAETEFFSPTSPDEPSSVTLPPPQLKPEAPRSSPAFRPIPEKTDPPLVPILIGLVLMVLFAVFSVSNCGDSKAPAGTVENPAKALPATPAPAAQPSKSAPTANVGSVGYLTVETNEEAIIYVDNVKQGRSPVRNIELPPGNHKIRALTIETGHRQVVTAHVVAGETRRVVLEFQ